jgi:nitrite reductase/ring-hydroxylating ferredoxin subunit
MIGQVDNGRGYKRRTMTAQEEHELLSRTGGGTPCGELMRRYWQPAALSQELTADKPLPVTILSEELIMFREGDGKPALIGRYCAHQGVDMIYGCVEPDGLRCMYHGWLFDNCGRVVMRGDWLPEKERRWDVGQPAYPCVERCGVIFTYMAKGEPPLLPIQEELADSLGPSAPAKDSRDDPYLQGMIGIGEATSEEALFVVPNLLVSPMAKTPGAASLCWHVPVDDNSHVVYTLRGALEARFSGAPRAALRQRLLETIETAAMTPTTSNPSEAKE